MLIAMFKFKRYKFRADIYLFNTGFPVFETICISLLIHIFQKVTLILMKFFKMLFCKFLAIVPYTCLIIPAFPFTIVAVVMPKYRSI